MLEPLVLFFLSLVLTLVLTPVMIRLANRNGFVDNPGARKVHDHPIPRLGGAAIFLTMGGLAVVALTLDARIRESFVSHHFFWLTFLVGSSVVFFLGLWDDAKGASVWLKFGVQTIAAFLVMFWGAVGVHKLTVPFYGPVQIGWLWIPLTAGWIVGVTNAFNLIDGLDGLAGGVAFISVSTIFIIALMVNGRSMVFVVSAALAGSLLGFLKYNFHPARIFLGDCGSMFLGYILAILSVEGSSKRTTVLALLIPMMIVGIPVMDTLYTMTRRLVRKMIQERNFRPSAMVAMFSADKAHVHHALMEMGYSHRRTVLILYGASIVFGLMALSAVIWQDDRVSLGLMLLGVVGFVSMKRFGRYVPISVRGLNAHNGNDNGNGNGNGAKPVVAESTGMVSGGGTVIGAVAEEQRRENAAKS